MNTPVQRAEAPVAEPKPFSSCKLAEELLAAQTGRTEVAWGGQRSDLLETRADILTVYFRLTRGKK